MRTIGLVTIGQAPRDDVLTSMLDPRFHAATAQRGALDDLDDDQISTLRPGPGDAVLVTRLRDGREVQLGKSRLMPHLQRALDRTVDDGAGLLVVLCTGEFSGLHASVPLIYPDRVLGGVVDALLPAGKIGVVMPHEAQAVGMRRKWERPDRRFLGATASPYTSADLLEETGARLRAGGADLILLDCMGFTSEMKTAVSGDGDVPVLLSSRLVGRVLEEIAESWVPQAQPAASD